MSYQAMHSSGVAKELYFLIIQGGKVRSTVFSLNTGIVSISFCESVAKMGVLESSVGFSPPTPLSKLQIILY